MKFYKLCIAILIAGNMISCAEKEFRSVETSNYVAFTQSSLSVTESTALTELNGESTITNGDGIVEIIRSGNDFTNPLTVAIEFSSVYDDSTSFADVGDDAASEFKISADLTSVTIPAGKVSTSFAITPKNDLAAKGNKTISLTIMSVSDAKYTIGNTNLAKPGALDIVLVDDDCPIDLVADWLGEYDVEEVFLGGTNEGVTLATFRGPYRLTMTADESDPSGTSVIWNNVMGSFGVWFFDGTVMQFQTCPETVLFDGETTVAVDNRAFLTYTESSFNTSAGTITCTGPTLGNFGGPYTFTLKKRK